MTILSRRGLIVAGTAAAIGLSFFSTAASAAETVKVAIGQKGLWDTMVTAMGVEKGFFEDEGLDVEITWTRGGAETLQAAMTGSTAFALANGTLGVLSAYKKGAPIYIVSSEMAGAPDLFWYAKTDSDINSLNDAAGKTVGFSRPGSSTHLTLLELEGHNGVDVKETPTGGISGTLTQVMSGQIDVGWAVPPFVLDKVQSGEVKVIARGSDVPHLADQSVRVNVVNADVLKNNPEMVEKFMRAYARTIDWMYEKQDEATAIYAKANEISEDLAREAISYYPRESLAVAPIRGLDLSMKQAIEHQRLEQPLTDEELKDLIRIVHSG